MVFLKNVLGDKIVNIYIDSPFETRYMREFDRLSEVSKDISLVKVREDVFNKDVFKKLHNADKIKEVADYVVDNSFEITKEQFFVNIYEIYIKLLKDRSVEYDI